MQLCLTNIFLAFFLLSCLCSDDHWAFPIRVFPLISNLGCEPEKKSFIILKDKPNIGHKPTVHLAFVFKKEDEAGPGSKGVLANENVHIHKDIAKCKGVMNTK